MNKYIKIQRKMEGLTALRNQGELVGSPGLSVHVY